MVIKGPWGLELFRVLTVVCLHESTHVINGTEPTYTQVSAGKTLNRNAKICELYRRRRLEKACKRCLYYFLQPCVNLQSFHIKNSNLTQGL